MPLAQASLASEIVLKSVAKSESLLCQRQRVECNTAVTRNTSCMNNTEWYVHDRADTELRADCYHGDIQFKHAYRCLGACTDIDDSSNVLEPDVVKRA